VRGNLGSDGPVSPAQPSVPVLVVRPREELQIAATVKTLLSTPVTGG
jgi:hypothetical protein